MVLLYLILVAQFQSFIDPFIILLAVPPGLTGVILTLWLTGTTLNVMSLMGVVMLVGIAVSNSILIVEFTRHLRERGHGGARGGRDWPAASGLRPVLMTSLATIIGLLPMALKLGAGSEAYAPLARAILGGLSVSVVLTVFLVPAAYVLVYGDGVRLDSAHAELAVMRASLFALIRAALRRGMAPARPCTSRWREAQQLAIQNNPQFTAAQIQRRGGLSGCRRSTRRLTRRAVIGNFTGVGADNGSRLAAGGLNNPVVYNRLGSGLIGQPDDHRFRPHQQPGRDGQAAGVRRRTRSPRPPARRSC